ncbi:hypothetical protein GCM10010211_08560 [Streptomyces albospinus]|uniref:Uncharacterized protein n=1 Tax=Streptomyces albospinus TaxID=285515 RepID=A0ABQ2UNZ8_9ACTN|nr:hypothetical protein [Streptomyces albospinus]GGU47084.1 hypothetical protein GCM10010211_08560 [Streptomyces albospinus]
MERTTARRAATAATSLLLTGAAALGIAGPAFAAAQPTPAQPSAAANGAAAHTVTVSTDAPRTEKRQGELTVRPGSGVDRTRALQIRITAPDGRHLSAADVRLERLDGSGRWVQVSLATQGGVLYAPTAGIEHIRRDPAHVQYRVIMRDGLPASVRYLIIEPRYVLDASDAAARFAYLPTYRFNTGHRPYEFTVRHYEDRLGHRDADRWYSGPDHGGFDRYRKADDRFDAWIDDQLVNFVDHGDSGRRHSTVVVHYSFGSGEQSQPSADRHEG